MGLVWDPVPAALPGLAQHLAEQAGLVQGIGQGVMRQLRAAAVARGDVPKEVSDQRAR